MTLSIPRRASLAAMVTLALAGCGDPVAPLPRQGAPDELVCTFTAYEASSTTVRLDGEAVVMTRRSWAWSQGMPVDSVRVVPSADAWAAFWAAAEQAGVRRWRERYEAENVIDGAGWSLRLTAEGRVIESRGSNAYPDRRGRENEATMPDAFAELMDTVGALVGREL